MSDIIVKPQQTVSIFGNISAFEDAQRMAKVQVFLIQFFNHINLCGSNCVSHNFVVGFHLFKVSGINVKELNDIVTQAIRLVHVMHNMMLKDENAIPCYIVFACGDDNWTVGCSRDLGVFYFYSDFSKFDKTHSANSLKFAEEYYKACGVPKRVLRIWKLNSKVIKGKGVSQPSVKFSCQYNLATGAPDTSLRNTVLKRGG